MAGDRVLLLAFLSGAFASFHAEILCDFYLMYIDIFLWWSFFWGGFTNIGRKYRSTVLLISFVLDFFVSFCFPQAFIKLVFEFFIRIYFALQSCLKFND